MSWTDRLLGAGLGALVVGILLGLLGFGPERVLTGLLVVMVASLVGALSDEYLEQRSRVPVPPVPTAPVATAPAPVGGTQLPVEPRRAPPTSPVVPEPIDPPPFPKRTARISVTPPSSSWVEAGPPRADGVSGRWAQAGDLNLRAAYLGSTAAADVVCSTCGRTVVAPEAARPDDCPFPDGTVRCVIRARDHRLLTRFQNRVTDIAATRGDPFNV